MTTLIRVDRPRNQPNNHIVELDTIAARLAGMLSSERMSADRRIRGWVRLALPAAGIGSSSSYSRSAGSFRRLFVEGDRHSEACRVIVGVGAVIQHQPFAWNDVFVMWPFGLLAHEVHYALGLFVQETGESTWAERLSACQLQANTLMPPREVGEHGELPGAAQTCDTSVTQQCHQPPPNLVHRHYMKCWSDPLDGPSMLVRNVSRSPCQGEGRGFESRRPLHIWTSDRDPAPGPVSRATLDP